MTLRQLQAWSLRAPRKVASLALAACCGACMSPTSGLPVQGEGTLIERVGFDPKSHAAIRASFSAPVGRFLLVRTKASLCAIKVYELTEEPSSILETSEGRYRTYNVTAKYDLYAASRNDKRSPEVWTKTSGRFQTNDLKPGRFGPRNISCDSDVLLGWFYPTWFRPYLRARGTEEYGVDLDSEFAPTAWSEPGKIDFQAPQLRWFRQPREKTNLLLLPIEALPGYGN